jgi:hypothetical protein
MYTYSFPTISLQVSQRFYKFLCDMSMVSQARGRIAWRFRSVSGAGQTAKGSSAAETFNGSGPPNLLSNLDSGKQRGQYQLTHNGSRIQLQFLMTNWQGICGGQQRDTGRNGKGVRR